MRVVPALILASLLTAAIAGPSAPAWAQLTVDQQEALRPRQQRWKALPEYQRTRLLGAAKHYAELSSTKQESFRKKLIAWTNLRLEQRDRARALYREYHRMPKADQARLSKLWRDNHPEAELAQSREERALRGNFAHADEKIE